MQHDLSRCRNDGDSDSDSEAEKFEIRKSKREEKKAEGGREVVRKCRITDVESE